MQDYKAAIFLLLVLLLGLAGIPAPANPVVFSAHSGSALLEVREPVLYLEDPSGQMPVQAVVKSDQFRLTKHQIPNLGVSASAFWLKMTIRNQSAVDNLLLEVAYPLLDEVCLYKVGANGVIDSTFLQERQSFFQRQYKYQNYLFNLSLNPGQTQTYYLRIKSGEQIIVPLIIGDLQSLSELHLKKDLIAGIYFGIVIVMILYNLFIYFTVKDKSYLFYVLYLFFVGLTQAVLQGYGLKYLWPGNSWLAVHSVYLTGALSGIATILFTASFLQTRIFIPRLHYGLLAIILFDVVAIMLAVGG